MKTHSHSIATLLLMSVALYFGIELQVGLLLIGFFLGREHAQAEQRGISKYYGNRRRLSPWNVGFEFRNWNIDSFLYDMMFPIWIVICLLIIQ